MRAIIIGCGRVGARLAQTLSLKGCSVTVVDKDPAAFDRLGRSFQGRTIQGVGFYRDVLLEAGIEKADELAAVVKADHLAEFQTILVLMSQQTETFSVQWNAPPGLLFEHLHSSPQGLRSEEA